MSYPETTFFSFDLPLSKEAAATLHILKERYVDGEGKPLVVFYTDSLATLRVPAVVKPRAFTIDEPIREEAPSLLRVPSDG